MDTEPEMVRDTKLVAPSPELPTIAPLNSTTETFMVTGGVSGHVAMTEDLHVAVQAIDHAATLLSEATRCTVATDNQIDSLPVGLVPDQEWQRTKAQCAVANVMAGPTGTRRAEEALLDIGDRLRLTVAAMEEAANRSESSLSAVARINAALQDLYEVPLYVSRSIGWLAWSATPARYLSTAMGNDPIGSALAPGVPHTTGLANRDSLEVLGTQLPEGARRALMILGAATLRLAEMRFYEPNYESMSARPGIFDGRDGPDSTAALLATVQETEELDDGSITIQRIPAADGECVIVTIPGTQDLTPFSGKQTDWHANAAYMAGWQPDAMKAVVDAMATADIPAGAKVMLVGHSQGGIGAMALASSPWFLEKYNVTHVVTSGASTGIFTTPSHIRSLHFEHPEDLTPGADFTRNADGPNQTTVTHAISQSADPALAAMSRTIGGAHHLDGYIATAAMVEATSDPSVSEFVESAREFLAGGSRVQTTVYTPKVSG